MFKYFCCKTVAVNKTCNSSVLFIKLLAGSLVRQCMHADLCCSVFALNCVILMLVVIVRIAIE